MDAPPRQRQPEEVLARPVAAVRSLQAFLAHGKLEVYDVRRGAGPGTRRLVVGETGSHQPTYVVSLATEARGGEFVDSEARHLRELGCRLRPRLLATLPAPLGSIEVGRSSGAVLSAVPGTRAEDARPPRNDLRHAGALLEWLTMLWEDTSARTAPVDVGARATQVLTDRFAGSRAAAPVLRRLEVAREALAGVTTPRTVSHGCLCPRHVRISSGTVVGVDDWGLARFDADPLSDLGGWVVASTGADLAAVLSGKGKAGRSSRDLLVRGLAHWRLPAARWRDVLLLCLAEAAVAGLARQDTSVFHLLTGLRQEISTPARAARTDGART